MSTAEFINNWLPPRSPRNQQPSRSLCRFRLPDRLIAPESRSGVKQIFEAVAAGVKARASPLPSSAGPTAAGMYVAPTAFALTVGTAHNQTLILPTGCRADSRFREVGRLVRHEPEKLVIGYAFDTRANTLVPELADNPSVGREHSFSAFRLRSAGREEVAVRPPGECSEARAVTSRTLGLPGLEPCQVGALNQPVEGLYTIRKLCAFIRASITLLSI